MKNKSNILLLAFALLVSTLAFSCKKDPDDPSDPHDHNETELITTVVLQLDTGATPGTHPPLEFRFRDPDGPGGNAPTVDTVRVDSGMSMHASLRFLDDSDTANVEDITTEIEVEADEHLVCWTQEGGTALQINVTDTDGNGLALGLEAHIDVVARGGQGLKIRLKHQPDGIKTGDCSLGETDAEVVFPFIIKPL